MEFREEQNSLAAKERRDLAAVYEPSLNFPSFPSFTHSHPAGIKSGDKIRGESGSFLEN
jgi:hypothetical protein